MEPIRLEFEWSEQEFNEAQWLHLKERLLARRPLAMVGCLFFGKLAWDQAHGHGLPSSFSWETLLIPLVGWISAFGIGALVFRVGVWISFKNAFRRSGLKGRPLCFSLSDSGIQISTPHSDGKVKWGLFERWNETANLLILNTGMLLYALPKRCMPEGAVEALRELMTEKIAPEGQTRSTAKKSD